MLAMGGTLITQYNTNPEFDQESFSTISLKLSRNRVTEENAEARIQRPDCGGVDAMLLRRRF